MFDLQSLGWNEALEAAFEPFKDNLAPARVAVEHRGGYVLYTADGESTAELAGRLRHEAESSAGLPGVGDWVAIRRVPEGGRALVEAVLPRRSKFSRKVPRSRTEEQVLAANVDTVFLVGGLGHDLNLRRLERYLTLAWESGAAPAIVLTKADLCDDVAAAVAEVETIALGVAIHPVSGVTGEGVEQLDAYLQPGRTVALLGSSGVGKSTLVNHLAGHELLATREIRSDGRGRHTTTRRELIVLPSGGLVIDTPGLRELQLWVADDGLDASFDDVATLAAECRFSDCAHDTEPGCAIRAALDDGSLDGARYASYRKLQRELHMLEVRADARLRAEEGRQRRRAARMRRRPKRY